jgi:four helix bundle protein
MGNFNKMEVWLESKELAVQIYHLTGRGPLSKDFSLRDQIRRAAISVPSNLAEGEESLFDKVSLKYFGIASASLAELRTQIEIAKDIGYLDQETFGLISEQMIMLSRRINKLIQFRLKKLPQKR